MNMLLPYRYILSDEYIIALQIPWTDQGLIGVFNVNNLAFPQLETVKLETVKPHFDENVHIELEPVIKFSLIHILKKI